MARVAQAIRRTRPATIRATRRTNPTWDPGVSFLRLEPFYFWRGWHAVGFPVSLNHRRGGDSSCRTAAPVLSFATVWPLQRLILCLASPPFLPFPCCSCCCPPRHPSRPPVPGGPSTVSKAKIGVHVSSGPPAGFVVFFICLVFFVVVFFVVLVVVLVGRGRQRLRAIVFWCSGAKADAWRRFF